MSPPQPQHHTHHHPLALEGGGAILVQTIATVCFCSALLFCVMNTSTDRNGGVGMNSSLNGIGSSSKGGKVSLMTLVRVAFVGSVLMLFPLLSSIYQAQHCTALLRQQSMTTSQLDLPHVASTSGSYYETLRSNDNDNSKDVQQQLASLEPPPPLAMSEEEAIQSNDNNDNDEEGSGTTRYTNSIDRIPDGNTTIHTKPVRIGLAASKKPAVKHHYSCQLTTPPHHRKTLARIILLQRDGRRQLRDFVTHYTRVLPYNSLVIMDHEGNDDYTQSLLQEYGELGAHIWRCEGSFKAKAVMWSQVTRVYARDSGFVFPVDVDELLAVRQQQQPSEGSEAAVSGNVDGGGGLEWSTKAFKEALAGLGRSGKPYKMNWIESVPSECHVHMKKNNHKHVAIRRTQQQAAYASEMCDIQFVKTKEIGCMDKTFSRGVQFHKTDTGNHYGGTRKYPDLSKALCEEKGLTNVYEISSLALIHLKEKTFEDWLVHGLRGATDRGFHRIMDIDCNKVQQSLHYCKKWEKITKAKFSPYALRKVYVEDVCPQPEDELMPVHETFCSFA